MSIYAIANSTQYYFHIFRLQIASVYFLISKKNCSNVEKCTNFYKIHQNWWTYKWWLTEYMRSGGCSIAIILCFTGIGVINDLKTISVLKICFGGKFTKNRLLKLPVLLLKEPPWTFLDIGEYDKQNSFSIIKYFKYIYYNLFYQAALTPVSTSLFNEITLFTHWISHCTFIPKFRSGIFSK